MPVFLVPKRSPIMSPFWLIFWAFAIALTWLLPNHFPPWTGFHADAWMGLITLMAGITLLVLVRTEVNWHPISLLFAFLALVPWFQFGAGLLPFAGQAWVSSLYISGFLLVFMFGERWESANPLQLANGLFLALFFATFISVWLQLFTWLALSDGDITDIRSMGLSGNRPYANLGQPNNLATLLIWGVLACFWAYLRGILGGAVATFSCFFLITGLALTQSRMGLLAATVLLGAIWIWRRLWPSRKLVWLASILYGYLWLAPFLLKWLSGVLLLDGEGTYLRLQQQGELRLGAWRLFLRAIAEHPWFGYGWTEVGVAQLAVADKVPGLGVTFGHSHNLFLDLLLWLGLPFGLVTAGVLIRWFFSAGRRVGTPEDAVLVMLLGVVGIHAMVELPLHYAYFLLPTGLVMGIICARSGAKVVFSTSHWTLGVILLVTSIIFGVVIRDYFRVEASYNAFRFEKARIGLGKTPLGKPPEVLMLTHLRDWNRLARFEVTPSMTSEQLQWMEAVTNAFPSAPGVYRLATALAMNDRSEDALRWLNKICKITDEKECDLIQRVWEEESKERIEGSYIKWPLGTENQ